MDWHNCKVMHISFSLSPSSSSSTRIYCFRSRFDFLQKAFQIRWNLSRIIVKLLVSSQEWNIPKSQKWRLLIAMLVTSELKLKSSQSHFLSGRNGKTPPELWNSAGIVNCSEFPTKSLGQLKNYNFHSKTFENYLVEGAPAAAVVSSVRTHFSLFKFFRF